jgi:HEAT repeat protein/type 1 glutamine amidotransferase
MLSGSKEYRSAESLAAFKAWLESRYEARCTMSLGADGGRSLPGLDALKGADVLVVFCRRMKLPAEQLAPIRDWCRAGKPVVGIRTASHAFQTWLAFDKEVLGGDYKGHGRAEPQVRVTIASAGAGHPVLAGVWPWTRAGKLYRNPAPAGDVTVLLTGKGKGGAQPLAWVRTRRGARVFYTSMGLPDDFQSADFRRLLANALFWTAARPVRRRIAQADLDGAFAALRTYDWAKDRQPLAAIDDAIVASHEDAAMKRRIENGLIDVLTSDAPRAARQFACRRLSVIGSAASVPALAKLLGDDEMSHMARYALERMATVPAARAALRRALGELKGDLRIGVIGSLARLRDEPSVATLAGLLGGEDESLALASAAALGEIGGRSAADALLRAYRAGGTVADAAAHGLLRCGQRYLDDGDPAAAAAIYKDLHGSSASRAVRLAALRGMVMAAGPAAIPQLAKLLRAGDDASRALAGQLVRAIGGGDVTAALVKLLGELPAKGQVVLLDALAARGDPAARPGVLALTRREGAAVRAAAFRALGRLGSADDVKLLARTAADASDPARQAAADSLRRLRGREINAAILALQRTEKPPVRVELIAALADRSASEAAGALFQAARDADANVRLAALRALTVLAGEADFTRLLAILPKAEPPGEYAQAEKALLAVAGRAEDTQTCAAAAVAALDGAATPVRCTLLRALAVLGGAEALAAVRAAAKDDSADICDAAVRALADWRQPVVLDDLLALAAGADELTHRVLALRGYVRLVGEKKAPPAEALALLRRAVPFARRAAEKKLIIAALAGVPLPGALEAVEPFQSDKELGGEAASAVVSIAGGLKPRPNEKVAGLLRRAIPLIGSRQWKRRAQRLLRGFTAPEASPEPSP